MNPQDILTEIAYYIPSQAFVFKLNGQWQLERPVGKDAIIHFLMARGMPSDLSIATIKEKAYLMVTDVVMEPGKPPLYRDTQGHTYINTWVQPTLTPSSNPFPTIDRVFHWLTQGDQEGTRWLKHWMALKIQNPSLVPKVAVVVCTEQGGGKGMLARIMTEMLGRENCAVVGREALESRFNSRWANKLFVLADEVLSSENLKDVSDRLKMLIDSPVIELEGKGKDQRAVKNRLAWMFASNDRISPVAIERGDRRYTVFSNFDPLPQDYIQTLNGCFEPDRETPTPGFLTEIQGLYRHLLDLEVDRTFVARPYMNEARAALIEANCPAHEMFCRYVDEVGIDDMLDNLLQTGDYQLQRSRSSWDFQDRGVSTEVLYKCYTEFCKASGARPLRLNRFGAAIQNHRPVWEHIRNTVTGTSQRVNCYKVRRKMKPEFKMVQGGK